MCGRPEPVHRIGHRVYEVLTLVPYLCSLQERAYLLLRMGSDGSEFNSSDSNSGRFEYEGDNHNVPADRDAEHDREDEEEEEEEEVEAGEGEEEQVREGGAVNEEQIDGALFDSDEAFARALQEKEDRDTTARLMALAGIHDRKFFFSGYIPSPYVFHLLVVRAEVFQHGCLFLCSSQWKLITLWMSYQLSVVPVQLKVTSRLIVMILR